MTAQAPSRELPEALRPYWIDGAEILDAQEREEDRPGRDPLGNAGRVLVRTHRAALAVRWPRGRVVRRLEESGLRQFRSTAEETELAEPVQVVKTEDVDPFLLEKSVSVTVRGRDFPGQQRAVIEAKVETLRREHDDAATPADRREAIGAMIRDLDEGLRSTVDLRTIVRRFRPVVSVKDPCEQIGTVVPVRAGSRIVYRVNSIDSDAGEEGEAEPMVFHVVALGAREAVLLYTGGVHGLRHLRDLEESRVHHAWFANRERAKTDATAPWIGRQLYRDLLGNGAGEIVVHRRRDPEPIAVEKVGEDHSFVRVDGRPLEVPVIRCRTSRDDDMIVLRDEQSPLLLRLEESGAQLVRTIDAILSAPDHKFAFPGDGEWQV